MNKENNKIIDEVKKFVNSNESKKEKVNLKKNDKIITNLVEEKVDSLDNTTESKLKSIKMYKLKDLQDICEKNNISIIQKNSNKKKLKSELYDELKNMENLI